MKTKHLFSAAMLTALFAACSNEELVNQTTPNVANDGRPMVENVKLNFGKAAEGEADTRINFDPQTGEYAWVNGDKVGALLMDDIKANVRPYEDPEAWAKLSWTEKYGLIDYIHTDYPFVYDATNKTWNSNAAMLEGNYFFVSPYEGYNSRRQLVHSIAGQTQKDGSLDATAKAFGQNQYWIGYSQIKEGNKTAEALTTVEMTRVLAPIRFTIKMIGTQTYKVNKITVQGADVRTLLTIDPTCGFNQLDGQTASVGYTGENGQGMYNLENGSGTDTKHFNYANYIYAQNTAENADMKDEVYDHTAAVTATNNRVFNIDDETNYDRFNALRAIIDAESVKTDEVQYAEMSYETEPTLKEGKEYIVNGVIFVNPDAEVKTGELIMNIYTDKGTVKNIDLTKVNVEVNQDKGQSAITDKAIKTLTPYTSNLVNIQLDDNSVDAANVLDINNSNDLEQFIAWNAKLNRPYAAVLKNNVTLTKDMVEALRAAKKANADNELIVTLGKTSATPEARKLIIAADAPADVFEFVNLNGGTFDIDNDGTHTTAITDVDVEVLGTVTLDTDKAIGLPVSSKKITVAKGATMNIAKANISNILDIENNGTIAMVAGTSAKNVKIVSSEKAEMAIAGELEFAVGSENSGKIAVAATGQLQGTTSENFTNKGLIENEGRIWNIVNDDVETAIVKTSKLTNHFASNGDKATIELTRLDDPVTVATPGGHIKFVGADLDLNDVTAAGVTDLVVSGYLRAEDDATTATVKSIIVEEGKTATIEGGSYNASQVWIASAQKLNVTVDAVLDFSGDVTMNHLSNAATADVNVLKGSLTIEKGTVACIKDLTLGSKEVFTEFGATVNIKKGATLTVAGTLARDTKVANVKPVINNEGTASAATQTNVGTDITVNGNTIQ